jgi:restriction system protein
MVWVYESKNTFLKDDINWYSPIKSDAINHSGICAPPHHCVYCRGKIYKSDITTEAWSNKSYHSNDCDDADDDEILLVKEVTKYLSRRQLHLCERCGWWIIFNTLRTEDTEDIFEDYSLCHSVLKELDVVDISNETDELCHYLLARYESRRTVNPKIFEEIVASVFKDRFEVRVTSYSGDDGIDIFVLDSKKTINETIGVQVKRWASRIEAADIREFAGSLMLSDVQQGIFVTTGEFRKGAIATAEKYKRKGYHIKLWDGKKFYDRLGIAWKPNIKKLMQSPPLNKWESISLTQVGSAHTYSAF